MTGSNLSDADQLAASRERYRSLCDAGWSLSQIAIASIGFISTPEGRACERALLREYQLARCGRALAPPAL